MMDAEDRKCLAAVAFVGRGLPPVHEEGPHGSGDEGARSSSAITFGSGDHTTVTQASASDAAGGTVTGGDSTLASSRQLPSGVPGQSPEVGGKAQGP
jgi:hypothetical protein